MSKSRRFKKQGGNDPEFVMNTAFNNDHHYRDTNLSNAVKNYSIPRHRWYYYKEGFAPNLVTQAIESQGLGPEGLIFDPFNGSGTVTLTADSVGIPSIGVEVNPFAAALAKAKLIRAPQKELVRRASIVARQMRVGMKSPLEGFSTFTQTRDSDRWLFNRSVIRAFQGGMDVMSGERDGVSRLLRMALVSAVMDNCNARKDGKCLRYHENWENRGYDSESTVSAFLGLTGLVADDLERAPISGVAKVICSDSRKYVTSPQLQSFDLCVTSPPYLNTFDYTDIYRPELFLGGFVQSQQELFNLRLRTVRSHVQAAWALPIESDFGTLYSEVLSQIQDAEDRLMSHKIPVMIQAYFEDMKAMLYRLRAKVKPGGSLWMVVSTSAYAGIEVPVDLILAHIGGMTGWRLREVVVLRDLQKRKSKHSDKINRLRESLIILDAG